MSVREMCNVTSLQANVTVNADMYITLHEKHECTNVIVS